MLPLSRLGARHDEIVDVVMLGSASPSIHAPEAASGPHRRL